MAPPIPLPPRKIDAWAPASATPVRLVLASSAPYAVVLVGIVLLTIGVVVPGAVLCAFGIVVALVNVRVGGAERVIARIGGVVLDRGEEPGLRNLVEGLCVASGQSVPELRLLEDPAPNALLLSRRGSAVLFCTTGLLELCGRIELEGILAHELSHLRSGDARRAERAMRALGACALVSRSTPRFVLSLGDPRREVLADFGASAMTRYPPGVLAGLAAIAGAPTVRVRSLDETAFRLTAPLWCAPLDDATAYRVRPGVLDLKLRIEALAEL